MKVLKQVVMWVLTLMLCAMFLNAGIRKLFENGGWSWAFRNWGFSTEFRILIGIVEAAAAVLLLIPRTAAYGAMTIILVMMGAISTIGVTSGRWQHAIPATVSLVVAGIVLALRWRVRQSFQRRIDSMT